MKNYPAVIRFADVSFDKQENLIIDGQKITEAMRKKNRPYAKVRGALIMDQDNNYFVPLRSHLNIRNYLKYPENYLVLEETASPDGTIQNLKGLQLEKTIVVNDDAHIQFSQRLIDKDSYENLMMKKQELYSKLQDFIRRYKQSVLAGKLDSQFRYTTLKHFHKELGLPPIEKSKQNSKRKAVAKLKGDSKRLDKKFVDKVIGDYRQEKRKSREHGKQQSKRQRRR